MIFIVFIVKRVGERMEKMGYLCERMMMNVM